MATAEHFSVLQNLLQTCIDGTKGLQAAAQAIDDQLLQTEPPAHGARRREFVAGRESAPTSFGQTTSSTGSVSAAVHRGRRNLSAAFSSNDRRTILAERERREDTAVDAYRDALSTDLPGELGRIVQLSLNIALPPRRSSLIVRGGPTGRLLQEHGFSKELSWQRAIED